VLASEELGPIREDLDVKHRRPKSTGGRQLLRHSKQGADFYNQTQEWHDRHRVIDHEHNPPWYFERIVWPDGTVVTEDQPLREHQGHGSAKKKSPRLR
jgi:hypothetical protein